MNVFRRGVVWQRWRRADVSIFAALNDLTKKLKFVKPTIAKCGKTFEKPCVEPLGSLSVSKPKAFTTNLSLELSFCLTTRKSAVVSADQLRNFHGNFSLFPYSPRALGLKLLLLLELVLELVPLLLLYLIQNSKLCYRLIVQKL